MIVDRDGTITYESPAVERVLGYRGRRIGSAQRLRGSVADDRSSRGRGSCSAMSLRAPAARRRPSSGSATPTARGARSRPSLKNLLDDPAVGGIVVNYRDITRAQALEDELRHQAFHDSLTGLANRALFVDRLEHALSRAARLRPTRWPSCSSISTTSRRSTTASATARAIASSSRVAERLRGALRGGDTIARMGGDEFAVLVEDADRRRRADGRRRARCSACSAAAVRPRRQGALRARQRRRRACVTRATETGARTCCATPTSRCTRPRANGKNRVEVFEPGMHAGGAGPARAEGRPRARPRARRVLPRSTSRSCASPTAADHRRRGAPALAASGARRGRPADSSRSPRRPA